MHTVMSRTPLISLGNKLRMEINSLLVNHHSKTLGEAVQTVKALDTSKKSSITDEDKTLLSHLPNTQTNGLPTNLKLFNGMLVNLTKNVSTDLGLTNDSAGVVR